MNRERTWRQASTETDTYRDTQIDRQTDKERKKRKKVVRTHTVYFRACATIKIRARAKIDFACGDSAPVLVPFQRDTDTVVVNNAS